MADEHPSFAFSRRRFLAAGAAAGVGIGASSLLAACNLDRGASPDKKVDPNASWGDSLLIDPPFAKPDVEFTDFDGEPYPLREKTKDRLTLLFFGYTHCPDVCPVYLSTLAGALSNIGSGPGSRPIVLFVGVDVARDTPEYMKRYLGKIDKSFIGLTPSDAALKQALGDLKLPEPIIGKPDADGNYPVDHPARITVFSPDDMAHRMYPFDVRQQQWVRDLPRLDQGIYA